MPTGWRILAPAWSEGVCLAEIARKSGYRVKEICDDLGCSEGYFRRVFVRDTGLSPKQWLKEERMLTAIRHLGEGCEWAEVAEALGFGSPASFRREFRGTFRITPEDWCRSQLEQED